MKKTITLIIVCLLTASCLDLPCYSGYWETLNISDGDTVSGTITFYAEGGALDELTVIGSDGKQYPDSIQHEFNHNDNSFTYKFIMDTTQLPNGKTSITFSTTNSVCDMDDLPANPTTINITIKNG